MAPGILSSTPITEGAARRMKPDRATRSKYGVSAADCDGAPAGGRPMWMPSTPSGSASSLRYSSSKSLPVTALASRPISQPIDRAW
ncbi:Uncharacterised protein [Mycobacteroides abscessus subsp. abscessus]|nr:Uncharacterised protein [Mycobacteroides abscessus subsp. abscessus]